MKWNAYFISEEGFKIILQIIQATIFQNKIILHQYNFNIFILFMSHSI